MEQLPLVEQHYRVWMNKLGISEFQTPEDLYLIVRGPYGIGEPDSFNMDWSEQGPSAENLSELSGNSGRVEWLDFCDHFRAQRHTVGR